MFFREYRRINRLLIAVCILFVAAYGCDKNGETVSDRSPDVTTGQGTGHGPASVATGGGILGKVITTMDSGGYTYVEVDTKEGKIWAAGPKAEIKVGDNVLVPPGNLMKDFYSKTLDRTFEAIYFVGALNKFDGNNAIAIPSAKKSDGQLLNNPHAKKDTGPAEIVKEGSIPKVEGGYTIGELFSERQSLKGKKVKVRGKVIKFNPGIMGKNWVHLKDGTEKGDQKDLTLTTQETLERGAIVVAEGNMSVDKDVGGGYFYALLIEDAQFTK